MLDEEVTRLWVSYQRTLVDLFDARTSSDRLSNIETETREELRREMPERPTFILDAHLRARLRTIKCAQMNAMGEDEFRAFTPRNALRAALAIRHGVDVLGAKEPHEHPSLNTDVAA